VQLLHVEVHYDKARISLNCNRRFKSVRGINMHSKMTATTTTHNVVDFIHYENYVKGLEMNRFELNFNCQSMKHAH
jgi:hypothetical protein